MVFKSPKPRGEPSTRRRTKTDIKKVHVCAHRFLLKHVCFTTAPTHDVHFFTFVDVDLQPPSVTLPPPPVAFQTPLDTSNRHWLPFKCRPIQNGNRFACCDAPVDRKIRSMAILGGTLVRRASFVTCAPPVDSCRGYVGQHYMDLPLGPGDISRCFDLGWVWTFSYPR